MKLFIVVDMEGATGIVNRDQLVPDGKTYAAGCKLLTADVNAAIEGALQAMPSGGDHDIVVGDGHAIMRNVILEDLHPAARLVMGGAANKPLCQCEGIDDTFDAAMFVGFHSRAGTPNGLLAHTFVGRVIHNFYVNGVVMGEAGVDARIVGHFGAPLLMVTGAHELGLEVVDTVGPHVRFVETKQSLGPTGAICLPPSRTKEAIRSAAAEAVGAFLGAPGKFPVTRVDGPVTLSVETHHRDMTEYACVVAGIERTGERTFATTAADMPTAFRTIWKALEYTMREYPDWLR